jgi:hypothetical protein
VLRGDGIPASDVHTIHLILIESMYEDCKILTSYQLDWTNYNHWQSGRHPGGGAALYLKFNAQGRDVITETFGLPFSFCGPYRTTGRPAQRKIQLGPNQNYFDIIDGVTLTASAVSGRVGQC